jgi:hypothetical protein
METGGFSWSYDVLIDYVVDPHHLDADPDPACHFDVDPDPGFQTKTQNLEKVLKQAHIPYILACLLQVDADPDPAYHFDRDPDPTFQFDADPCGSGSTTLLMKVLENVTHLLIQYVNFCNNFSS